MKEQFKLTKTQQAAAIDRRSESLALLSGAGCGKTFVLARRFTELLMKSGGKENPLSQFVALTFTEKAAMEMSQRVRDLLSWFAAHANSDEDRNKWRTWLGELPDARISTIHGFCAALLRTHAIEAGIDPNFAVASDQLTAGRMCNEAAEQAVLHAVEAGREDVSEVLTAMSFDSLVALARSLTDSRTAWQAGDYCDPTKTLQRWAELRDSQGSQAWKILRDDSAFHGELDALDALSCTDSNDKLIVYRDEQFAVIRKLLADPASRTVETFDQLSSPRSIGSKKAWGDAETVKSVRTRIAAIVKSVAKLRLYVEPFGELDEQAARLLTAVTHLAGQANIIYAAAKRRSGLLDFTDLLEQAHKLLCENEPARRALSDSIDQLLVDEAQDTDAFQIELIERLMFGRAGDDNLPDGRLFLVGDAKQSIYRFRGAQVEVFENLCDRLGRRRRENLNRSFRTHSGGVEFINRLFGPMMGEAYEPISAHRIDCPPAASVEILLAGDGEDFPVVNAKTASAAQAALVAQRIAEMVENAERRVWDAKAKSWRPVRYGDVAILFSRMTVSGEYERRLAQRGVPYYVLGGTGFFQRQEVFDLLNALRCIENPRDDVALFGVLRSGLVGVDDNALMRLAETFEPPYLPNLLAGQIPAAGLDEQTARTVTITAERIDRLARRKDAASIDALLEELLGETGYEAVLAAQFQGTQRIGNVRMLIERARAAGAAGASLAEFLTEMDELTLSESRYEQASVTGEAEDVVRLMTIHKAKGLEFPVVFIPDLNSGRRHSRGLLNRVDWGLTYKLRTGDDDEHDRKDGPLSHRLAHMNEDADQRAEDIRKLYVAVTRHEDHLVLVGADWRDRGEQLRDKSSYLRQLDDVLGLSDALDAGTESIPYGADRAAVVKRIAPTRAKRRTDKTSPGSKLLTTCGSADELLAGIARSAGKAAPPKLLTPLSVEHGRVELAVTALGDFARCPMLYRWRYELRVPRGLTPKTDRPSGSLSIDPATLGTLVHLCMERQDFAQPLPADQLARQAANEMGLDNLPDLDTVADQVEAMLADFAQSPLAGQLAQARQIHRELDFVMQTGPAVLHGQIDLLFQDAAGDWRLVDYKSDRVAPADVAAHSASYELQLMTYVLAARRFGSPPAEASLYFLRPGKSYAMSIDAAAVSAAEGRLTELASQLIASRRSGRFVRSRSDKCEFCPFTALCKKNVGNP